MWLPPIELVLGSATDKTPNGYRLEVQLDQNGAGIESALSSRYDAEFEGRKNPHRPLQLIRRDPILKPSMSLTLSPVQDRLASGRAEAANTAAEAEEGPRIVPETEDMLDSVLWEVVRDANGKAVHPITALDPDTGVKIDGQEVAFRTTAASGVTVTKTFRLRPNADGLEVDLKFESPDKERTFSYNLLGPHGIPIEGEWYTGTFREVFFGTWDGSVRIDTHTAYDIAKGKPIDSTALPMRFTGVENQYFAIFMAPYPAPTGQDDRIDSKTQAVLLHKDETSQQKSDVGVRLSSKALKVGPNTPVVHTYRVFLGPKTPEALSGEAAVAALTSVHGPKTAETLRAYDAGGLSAYRKSSIIPGASYDSPVRHHAGPGRHPQSDHLGRPALRRHHGELGNRHHPHDLDGEADHVPAGPQAGPDGPAHPGAPALPQGDPGEVQGREGQGEADTRDSGPVQEARGQPGQRLHPGPDPVAHLRGALAGPQQQRIAAAFTVPLDQRPRRARICCSGSRSRSRCLPLGWATGSTSCRSWWWGSCSSRPSSSRRRRPLPRRRCSKRP